MKKIKRTRHEHRGYQWLDPHSIDLTAYLKSGNLEVMRMYLGDK